MTLDFRLFSREVPHLVLCDGIETITINFSDAIVDRPCLDNFTSKLYEFKKYIQVIFTKHKFNQLFLISDCHRVLLLTTSMHSLQNCIA